VRGRPPLRVAPDRLRLLPAGGGGPPRRAAAGPGRVSRREHLGELRTAAQAGDSGAAYRLGLVHQQGLAGTSRDPRLATRYFESAAEAGHPWARFRLAQMLDLSGADRARSLELKTAAAQAGVAEAAALLGTQYREGRGGVPRDPAEAARWFKVAAENGVPEAQYNLGLMHYRGEGVPRQLYEALRWMRQAATGGHVPAQRAVGQLYLTGLDTMGQDLQEARAWLASAASNGDRESQRLLGELDRARAAELDYARRLRLLSSYTAAYWGSAAYAGYWWRPYGYYGRYYWY
jgi:uncharacterized protein